MAAQESESDHGNDLTIGFLNIRGQTKFSKAKQKMIEESLKRENLDILHLQEVQIDDNSFDQCEFIQNQFQIVKNNAQNGYGVCSIVRRSLNISNVRALPGGRIVSFDIGRTRFGNIYISRAGQRRKLIVKKCVERPFLTFSSTPSTDVSVVIGIA